MKKVIIGIVIAVLILGGFFVLMLTNKEFIESIKNFQQEKKEAALREQPFSDRIRVETEDFDLDFNRKTGTLEVRPRSEQTIVKDLYPHHENEELENDDILVKKLVLHKGITGIENSFNHLIYLESIELPSSLKYVKNSFNEAHSLKKLDLPITFKRADRSFNSAGIKELDLGGQIFMDTSFNWIPCKKLQIPASSSLSNCFNGCGDLADVVVEQRVAFGDRCFINARYNLGLWFYQPTAHYEEYRGYLSSVGSYISLPALVSFGESPEDTRLEENERYSDYYYEENPVGDEEWEKAIPGYCPKFPLLPQ